MPQTKEGALKVAAKKSGLDVLAYLAKVAAGEKWCTRCRAWHPQTSFGRDASRWDGLAAACSAARAKVHRETYQRVETPARRGPLPIAARDGDKRQARARVNALVRTGRLARPNSLPCFDCGHVWKKGRRRHEYDHHLGYAAEHHLHVQAVCTRCHDARERALRTTGARP